jgi:hypothetical protein
MVKVKLGKKSKSGKRGLLLTISADDCRWEYFRGSGKGGQKRQKTSSAVRCTHPPSEAVGKAEDTRQQSKNKCLAFKRMAESSVFKNWIRLEVAKITGVEAEAQAYVEREINSNRVRVEVKEGGRWIGEDDAKTEDQRTPGAS